MDKNKYKSFYILHKEKKTSFFIESFMNDSKTDLPYSF